jgi:hypothetical protein
MDCTAGTASRLRRFAGTVGMTHDNRAALARRRRLDGPAGSKTYRMSVFRARACLLSTARLETERFSALCRALDVGAWVPAALLVTEPVLQGAMGRDE